MAKQRRFVKEAQTISANEVGSLDAVLAPAPVKPARPNTVPAVLAERRCCYVDSAGRCPNPAVGLVANTKDDNDYTMTCDLHVKKLRRPQDEVVREGQPGFPWAAPVAKK